MTDMLRKEKLFSEQMWLEDQLLAEQAHDGSRDNDDPPRSDLSIVEMQGIVFCSQ